MYSLAENTENIISAHPRKSDRPRGGILGIELELACNGGSCGAIFSHPLQASSVQYRESEIGLLALVFNVFCPAQMHTN